jgi:hypothetical protein
MPGANNAEMIEGLSAWFMRNDRPQTAWGNVVSAFSLLPILRGFWPSSSADSNFAVYDLSGQGRMLTNINNANLTRWNLAPAITFNGATQYLTRATEPDLAITNIGLTLGGWFRPTAGTVNQGVMIKGINTVNDAYWLYVNPASTVKFGVWNGGAITAQAHINTYSNDEWYFWVGRWNPSTEIAVFQNGVFTKLAVGIPAAITNSAANFSIGSYSGAGGSVYYGGYGSLFFLCHYPVPDTHIYLAYEISRPLFGR